MRLTHSSSLEQICSNIKFDFRLSCPILFGLTNAAPTTYAACLHAEYGSIKSWQLKRKEGCEMAGGYIPPVLHSFLYNFKVLNVIQNNILISRFKLRRAPRWSFFVLFSYNGCLSHTWTCLQVKRSLFQLGYQCICTTFAYFIQIVIVV